MLLSIEHTTELAYSAPISETVMELRMTPSSNPHQTLRAQRVDVAPQTSLFEHQDWLHNVVLQFSILPFCEKILIVAQNLVETHPRYPALSDLGDPLPEQAPWSLFDYVRFHGMIDRDPRLAQLADELGLGRAVKLADVVLRITDGLSERIRYEKGVTHSGTRVEHVLDHRAGVCQDFAHLAIALLRLLGAPARYVAGYVHREGGQELETHAWVEVHFPSFGWYPFDPTHSTVLGPGHVAVAAGPDFTHVPPNRGVYRGDAPETIAAKVFVTELAELPSGLRAPREQAQADAPTLQKATLHRERIDYQQEQQQQQ